MTDARTLDAAPPLSGAGLEVLWVEDDTTLRAALGRALRDAGYQVTEAIDGSEARRLAQDQPFDVAILDVRLPEVDGHALLRRILQHSPTTTVIVVTADATVPDAVAALREGAFDLVAKPFDTQQFTREVMRRAAERALARRELQFARRRATDNLAEAALGTGRALIGRSPAIQRVLQQVELIAQTDAPVLLSGESGTGKELVARLLHDRSARRNRPFVAVNCAALPEPLLEAELFGHERGAFTGAERKREGRFQAAQGGTLLLDEISELPLASQTKLLRVLQESTIEPLGSNVSLPIDVRIISATNRNLKELVAERRFRDDLYYRLNVLDLALPPLRERRADLPPLLEHFIRRFAPPGLPPLGITPRAWAALCEYPFPGNVRELEHAIERAVVLARGQSEIDLPHLPTDIGGSPLGVATERHGLRSLALAVHEFEGQHLLRALELSEGRRGEAAKILGISRKSLWQKLKLHGLSESARQGERENEPQESVAHRPS